MWAILFRKIPHRWYILVILLYCAETGNWFQHSPLVYICFHVVVVSRFIHSQLIRVNNPVTILSHSDQMRAINPHPCTSTYTLSSQHCLFCIYVSFYIPKNRRTQRYQPKTIQNSVLETVQKHYYYFSFLLWLRLYHLLLMCSVLSPFFCFSFSVRKDLELRLQFRFFNNLHRKSTRIQ